MAKGAHLDQGGTGGLAAAIEGTWRGDSASKEGKPKPVFRCANVSKNCRATLRSGKKEGDFCDGCLAGMNPDQEMEARAADVHGLYARARQR